MINLMKIFLLYVRCVCKCTHTVDCIRIISLTGERVLHGGEHSEGTGPGDHRRAEPGCQHVPGRKADHRLCGGLVLRLLKPGRGHTGRGETQASHRARQPVPSSR